MNSALLHRLLSIVFISTGLFFVSAVFGHVGAIGSTLHWTGTTDTNWSVSTNWGENQVPADGDSVYFPDGPSAAKRHTVNDIAGLDLVNVDQDGSADPYFITGNSFTVSNAVHIHDDSTMDIDVDMSFANNAFIKTSQNAILNLNGVISEMAGGALYFSGAGGNTGQINIKNKVTGTFSDFHIVNIQTVSVKSSSSNDFVAPVNVESGTLVCEQANCFGNSSDVVTVSADGPTIAFAGPITVANPIMLNGYTNPIMTIIGTVNLNGLVTLNGSNRVYVAGDLTLSGGITGSGTLVLDGSNPTTITTDNSSGFTGSTDILGGSTLIATTDDTLGDGTGTVTVEDGATLKFAGPGNTSLDNPVTINGAGVGSIGAIWTDTSTVFRGAVVLGSSATMHVESSGIFDLFDTLGGTGDLTKEGGGFMYLDGTVADTYSGKIIITDGTLVATKSANTESITGDVDAPGGTLTIFNANQIADSSTINLGSSGFLLVLANEQIKALTGSGAINITSGNTLLVSDTGTDATYDGNIFGAGDIDKQGTNTWTLTANNTITGTITLTAGNLVVDGSQPDANIIMNGGVLMGTGTVGAISNAGGGKIAPGHSPGTINSAGPVVLSGSIDFEEEITGVTPGTQYDVFNVTGTIDLNNANLVLLPSGTQPNGSVFTIINASGGVSGIFSGKPENSLFTAGGKQWRINYTQTSVQITLVSVLAGTGTDVPVYAAGIMLISLGGFALLKLRSKNLAS